MRGAQFRIWWDKPTPIVTEALTSLLCLGVRVENADGNRDAQSLLNPDADHAASPPAFEQHGFEAGLQLTELSCDRRIGGQERPPRIVYRSGLHVQQQWSG